MALSEAHKKRLAGGGATLPTGGKVQKDYVGQDVGIRYHGSEITLPDTPVRMKIPTAIAFMTKVMEEEEQIVDIMEPVDSYIWDGAYQFNVAMKEMFGHVHGKTIKTLFGDRPPKFMSVEYEYGKHTEVPWGLFELPGFEEGEVLGTGAAEKDGKNIFVIHGRVKRKRKAIIQELAQRVRELVRTQSIYKGKAIELPTVGTAIDTDKAPRFLDLSRVNEQELTFSPSLQLELEANLFDSITHPKEVAQLGVPSKRTVVLAGVYGTGKTMTAMVAAKLCTQNNRTFFYIKDVRALARAIEYAVMYGEVCIFAEDFDRVADGERNIDMDRMSTALDGIEKGMDLIVVLTTNHPEKIHDVFRRSGRIDHLLVLEPPDAHTVMRLISLYGGDLVDIREDFTEVCNMLAGRAPADIREIVDGAKRYAYARTKSLENILITPLDLISITNSKDKAKAVMTRVEDKEPELTAAMRQVMDDAVTDYFLNGGGDRLADVIADRVSD